MRRFFPLLLFILFSCQSKELIKYHELSFEERMLYDKTFEFTRSQGKSKKYAKIIAKKSIMAKRNSEWVHYPNQDLPKAFREKNHSLIHLASNTSFPLTISNFIRSEKNIKQYDQAGNDISLGYNLHGTFPLSLTQYLHKDQQALKEHAKKIKKATKSYHPNATFIEEKEINKNQLYLLHRYHLAGQQVYSSHHLFNKKGWVTYIKTIFPVNHKELAQKEIEKYLAQLPSP